MNVGQRSRVRKFLRNTTTMTASGKAKPKRGRHTPPCSDVRAQADAIERLASFPELNPNPVIEVDSAGKITYRNPATVETLITLGLEDNPKAFLPRDMNEILDDLKQKKKKKSEFYREVRLGNAIFGETFHFTPDYGAVRIYATDMTERKRAEVELRRQREELQTIFDSVPAMIFQVDGKHRLVHVNRAYVDAVGLPKEKLEGKSTRELFPNQANRYWRDDEEVMTSGRPKKEIVEPFETPTGTRWAQTDKTPYRDATGNITGVLAFALDITERKRAEGKLRESEQLYRTLAESSPDDIIIVRRDSSLQYMNRSGLKHFGLTLEEIIGKKASDLFPPEAAKRVGVPVSTVLQTDEPIHTEEEVSFPDAVSWRDEHWLPLKTGSETTAVLVISRDVTERKRLLDEVQEREKKYRTLIEQSLQGILVAQGIPPRLVFANPAIAKFLGYTPDELTSLSPKQVEELVHREDRETFFSRFRERLQGKPVLSSYEFRAIRKGGEVRWLEVSANRIEYQGQPAVQATFVDITERVRHETRLQTLHDHASQLGSANDIDAIVKCTLDAMGLTLGFEHADFLLVENAALQMKGRRGLPVVFSAQPLNGRGLTVKATNTKSTLRISDTRKEPAYVDPKGYDWTGPPTVLSELIVPVFTYSQVVAVLCVDSTRTDNFNDDDQNLLETLATHVGAALGRLRDVESLRKSEAMYRRLFESSQEGIIILDADTLRILDSNPFLQRLSGLSLDQLLGRELRKIEAFNDVKGLIDVEELRQKPFLRLEPTPIEAKERGSVDVEFVSTVYEADGRKVIQCNIRDVTERTKLQKELQHHVEHLEEAVQERTRELRDNEERYHLLVDNTETGFVVVDDKGIVIEANEPYLRLVGAGTMKEIIGHSVIEWTAPEEKSHNAEAVALCARQGYIQDLETTYLQSNGTHVQPSYQRYFAGDIERKNAHRALPQCD